MMQRNLRNLLAVAGTALAFAVAGPALAGTFTITVDDGGGCAGTWQTTGSATNPTITCVGTTPPPAGAPSCTITPSQTVSSNTSVNLVATCTAPGGGALSYSWQQGSPSGLQIANTASYTTPLLQLTTTFWVTATADGKQTSLSTTVTVAAAPPPPPTGACANYSAVNLGDLAFDGDRVVVNVSGTQIAYGRITIPSPLPSGWLNKTAAITVFEYAGGSLYKKSYLSKTPCDFGSTAALSSIGVVNNLYMVFNGVSRWGALAVQPGEVWYLNMKNENYFGLPSCQPGLLCNFALSVFPPG